MKKFSLFFVFCFLCLSVQANVFEHKTNLDTISKNIPEMESIKCKFVQEKSLINIQKPIISKGDFEFKKGEGVYFYTTDPIKSVTNYSNKSNKQINDVVNAISNKKYSKLEKEFDFYYSTKDSEWTLGLKPKDSNISAYISEIVIEGGEYINKISMVQTNGNRTTLWFTKENL